MGRDPLVIKATRVDVLYGETNLMDAAASTDDIYPGRMLIHYRKNDDIIPLEPTCQWLHSLAPGNESCRQMSCWTILRSGFLNPGLRSGMTD